MTTSELYAFKAPTGHFPLCAAECALLAEVSHRTANQFTVLASYIQLSLAEFRRQPTAILDLQLAFAAVEARARSLAGLNRELTARTGSSEPVDVSVMLHEICNTFRGSGGAAHSILDAIHGTYRVTPAVNMAIGQIVTEAVMNALKYAYPADRAGEITVRSTPTESGELLIAVDDRGVGGLPASLSATATSFGVRLMRGLARQESIGLSFIDASPGLSVRLVAPPAAGSEIEHVATEPPVP